MLALAPYTANLLMLHYTADTAYTAYTVVYKGSCQKLLSGFFPLRGCVCEFLSVKDFFTHTTGPNVSRKTNEKQLIESAPIIIHLSFYFSFM